MLRQARPLFLLLPAMFVLACSGVQTHGEHTSSCSPCVISSDCSAGETCHQFPSGSFCVRSCSTDSDCSGDQICSTTAEGGGICVNKTGACSAAQEGASDGGSSISALPPSDPGTFTSSITPDGGGTASQLLFAVVGDTRPSLPDISSYPTDKITRIFQDIQSLNPTPPIVIGTGDYQFTIPDIGSSQQKKQLGAYRTARMGYSGVFWPAMGNHECDSITADVCGPGTIPGVPANFTVFQSMFLAPIGETNPYFARTVTASDGSWSADFIFVAPNFWSDAQATWFQQQISTSTATYRFVIHHENQGANGPPPALAQIEMLEQGHETLSLVGHVHMWRHDAGSREVIVGNGGAPLDASGQTYGYTLVARQADGTLLVTNHDYMTNQVVDQFTVTP